MTTPKAEGTLPRTWTTVQSPLYWDEGRVVMLDQRLLPGEEKWRTYRDHREVAEAIRSMVIRGAPAIGCAAAMGLAAGALHMPGELATFRGEFLAACDHMAGARPTAVNLFWAIARQRRIADEFRDASVAEIKRRLVDEAQAIWREDIETCREIGRRGAALIPGKAQILTHCNAGALATAGYGTALGVVRAAVEAGKQIAVLADETRPYLQGARLTAWELMRDGIDTTLICDNMAASCFQQGLVSCCVVGADRIARNGDVVNKIGTYNLAVLAHHHDVPFYVAAPRSTIDRSIASGRDIPIEERAPEEVTHIGNIQLCPEGTKVKYPAFDVTPYGLVTAVIAESGVARPPNEETIAALFEGEVAG